MRAREAKGMELKYMANASSKNNAGQGNPFLTKKENYFLDTQECQCDAFPFEAELRHRGT